MNREQKETVIQELKNNFSSSEASFLVAYKGLSVAQVQALRRKLRAQGSEFKVVKARLMKRAAEGVEGIKELSPFFKNQVALVFANKEVAPVAKTLVDFSKEFNALTLVVGCAEKHLMSVDEIKMLASLPSREVLLAQLCGVLQAPMASLARVVNLIHEQSMKQTA
jgi:large subunit ribosomal protein L10